MHPQSESSTQISSLPLHKDHDETWKTEENNEVYQVHIK